MKFSDSFMTEDIKLLGQRQRTLLITAQQAARDLCSDWFSLLPKSHGVEAEGAQVDAEQVVES